jgi:hypothetical protein
MVLTGKSYIGLAPRLTCEGDCLALVKGERVALILRPREATDGSSLETAMFMGSCTARYLKR